MLGSTIDKISFEEDWDEYIKFVETLNEEDLKKENKYELIQLAFCLWLLIEEFGLYCPKLEVYIERANSIFLEIYELMKDKYSDDKDFKFFFGYMISIFPAHFTEIYPDYDETKKMGKNMIKNVSNENVLAYVFSNHSDRSAENIQKAKEYLYSIYSQNTFIGDYFTRIMDIK